jgi:hypothetical protein
LIEEVREMSEMNKKWLVVLVIGVGIGLGAAARKCASMCSSSTGSAGSGKATKWDKMRARMEQMPEDFPPRVMFDNVQAARDNTERILEILEADEADAPQAEALADASV